MLNLAIDLLLLLGGVSIVVLRFLGLRRPPLAGWSTNPNERRTILSIWFAIGGVLAALLGAVRFRFDLDANNAHDPVNGMLLFTALIVFAVAAGLWAFRTYGARAAR